MTLQIETYDHCFPQVKQLNTIHMSIYSVPLLMAMLVKSSTACSKLMSEDVAAISINGPCCSLMQSTAKLEKHSSSYLAKVNKLFQEDVTVTCAVKNTNLLDQDLANAFKVTLALEDDREWNSTSFLSSSMDGLYHEEDKTCPEVHDNAFLVEEQRNLSRSSTFPPPRNMSTLRSAERMKSENVESFVEQSSCEKPEIPACTRSISLPKSVNLISAMKGGRKQNELSSKTKLTVKWAPDVYDPPPTSVSHSVKSHQYRPKVKKKDTKHKHKSKSSRMSGSEKKHHSGRRYL